MEKKTNRNSPMNTCRKKILIRATIAYLALLGLPGVILLFSFAQEAGWKPVLVGIPVILTIFSSITYQLIKELLALGREERGDPELPPKSGPWDDE
jgi:hypothetical protein